MKLLSNNLVQLSGIHTLSDFSSLKRTAYHYWRGCTRLNARSESDAACFLLVMLDHSCMLFWQLEVRTLHFFNGVKKAACPVTAPAETRFMFHLQIFCTLTRNTSFIRLCCCCWEISESTVLPPPLHRWKSSSHTGPSTRPDTGDSRGREGQERLSASPWTLFKQTQKNPRSQFYQDFVRRKRG